MSRFAVPEDRSRPKAVARSPSRPVQHSPGHRYGRGTMVPGASMKGSHVIEIKVQGTTRRSATSPHREDREDSASMGDSYYSRSGRSRSRSGSPNSTGSTDLTVTTNRSQFSSASMHLSSTKPFRKPDRTSREYVLKGPLPETANKVSVNREGISVNAEVISVSNTFGSTNYNHTSPSASPSPSLGAGPHGQGHGSSGPSGPSGASIKSSSTRGGRSASPSSRSVGSATSRTSTHSKQSATSYRSSYSKYTNTNTLSSLNDLTASSLYQSLAQNHGLYATASAGQNVHNLQLSQQAYRHVRKSQVRGAIAQFLQDEEEFQSLANPAASALLLHPHATNIFGGGGSATGAGGPGGWTGGSGSVGGGGSGNVFGATHPFTGHTYISSGPQSVHSSASEAQRAAQKKQLYVQKLIDNLRRSIWTEIDAFRDASPATLFFDSYNMHMPAMEQYRGELYSLVMTWQLRFVRDTVGLLDSYFVKYAKIQHRKATQLAKQQRLSEVKDELLARRAELKTTLVALRSQAEARGLGQRLQQLLARFPADWFMSDADFDSPQGYFEDFDEASPEALRSYLQNSVFLSPDKMHQLHQGQGGSFDSDDEAQGPGPGPGPGPPGYGPGQALAEPGSLREQLLGAPAAGVPERAMDRFAVNFDALRLLADPPPAPPAPPGAQQLPPPPADVAPGDALSTASSGVVYYNISPDQLPAPVLTRRDRGRLVPPTSSATSSVTAASGPSSPSGRAISPGSSLAAAHKIDLHYLAYASDPRPPPPPQSPSGMVSPKSGGGGSSGLSSPRGKLLTPRKRMPANVLSDFS